MSKLKNYIVSSVENAVDKVIKILNSSTNLIRNKTSAQNILHSRFRKMFR